MTIDRSLRSDVRNPLCALPAVHEIKALPLSTRLILKRLLRQLSTDARERAEKCWRTHKAPMAVYWKTVAVYAGHAARVMERKGAA